MDLQKLKREEARITVYVIDWLFYTYVGCKVVLLHVMNMFGNTGGEWDTTDTDDDYGTDTGSNASSTCSSKASSRSQGRKPKGPLALMTRIMKKKKLRRARKKPPPLVLEPGARLVVETLSTASCATVVWQVQLSTCP